MSNERSKLRGWQYHGLWRLQEFKAVNRSIIQKSSTPTPKLPPDPLTLCANVWNIRGVWNSTTLWGPEFHKLLSICEEISPFSPQELRLPDPPVKGHRMSSSCKFLSNEILSHSAKLQETLANNTPSPHLHEYPSRSTLHSLQVCLCSGPETTLHNVIQN